MTRFNGKRFQMLSGLAAFSLLCGSLPANDAGLIQVQPGTNAVPSSVAASPQPTLESPMEQFRQLLAMRPAERRQALTNRTSETARKILAKVREYESLKPEERELRLRATELQWYLRPLMTEPATNRAAKLALIPEEQRKLVEERLNQWDLFPPTYQEELLNNELTARYFAQLEAATSPLQRSNILKQISPERRAMLEAGLDNWRSLSEEQRGKTLEQFNHFFELTAEEKERALNTLSDDERQQMEKTLEAYARLPVDKRAQCVRAFERFAAMSLAERQQFLKNAERWKLMSPAERESWRHLVTVAPIMPPTGPFPPRPPMILPRRPVSPPGATN